MNGLRADTVRGGGWRRGRRRQFAALVVVAATWLLGLGCEKRTPNPGLVAEAKFGVWFGGQIQEREEIPFELDQGKLRLGMRLDFARPLPREMVVRWELDMPGSSRRVRDRKGRIGKGRLVRIAEATVPAGRERFDQLVPFEPGDPLGTWNIRVTFDEHVVIDRAFLVFDEAARRRRMQRDAGHP